MAPRLLAAGDDPVRPGPSTPLTIDVDGEPVTGIRGQSLAGVILAGGTLALRRTSVHGGPRGVFCGIGVCYDCLVEVNGQRDVRSCQRRAADGDVVRTQYDPLPEAPEGDHA
ncbi:(2Fe-2S)-binding protein [Cryobacterium tepidiphilum]|uniref:(2Fe-2S)-binding protein n=1 Tax=Cryobacterium tepidiphilum TaxID=2486026 RepID=A0A3M8KWH1_9MICO|nr:(2Fe-2S)-binding protein [Cryobacterium tepidiphilum]RNE56658.1 (2Fe-2S)-binding protein [Cryobacterium tepidiphilum]